MLILISVLKIFLFKLLQYRQWLYAINGSRMRTFGVRIFPRELLLVVTDPEETSSETELERVRLRPFPLAWVITPYNAIRNIYSSEASF